MAIVLDTETTGLEAGYDEIVQIAIISAETGEVLLNTLVRPVKRKRWPSAQRIHGISPDMVKEAPTFEDIAPRIREIITAETEIIGYNGSFDWDFIRYAFPEDEEPNLRMIDVMKLFAPVYGEWVEYFDDYKWQTLSTCADYFGYDFGAHDALEDCKATLFCYRKIQDLPEKKRKRRRWCYRRR